MCVLPPLVPIVKPQVSHFPSLLVSTGAWSSLIVQLDTVQFLSCLFDIVFSAQLPHEAACESDSVAPHFVQSLACNLFEPTYQLPNVC